LLCGKLAAAVLSGSLSVITSVIDSAVDLASGVLMWWSSRAVKYRDPYLYPQGMIKAFKQLIQKAHYAIISINVITVVYLFGCK